MRCDELKSRSGGSLVRLMRYVQSSKEGTRREKGREDGTRSRESLLRAGDGGKGGRSGETAKIVPVLREKRTSVSDGMHAILS
jgi:hypothetical protein